jgi:hypothetical protein
LGALFHAGNFVATLGTGSTDFRADAARFGMKRRATQHEVRTRLADFRAVDHQAEVSGFGMLSARFKAMGHRLSQTHTVAVQAFVNALLHGLIIHDRFPSWDMIMALPHQEPQGASQSRRQSIIPNALPPSMSTAPHILPKRRR